MKIKLEGYKSREIADLEKIVVRGEIFDVDDSFGQLLLAQNTPDRTIWGEVKEKKGGTKDD